MARPEHPITMAIRFLREREVPFTPHLYRYTGGGARGSSEALDVPLMRVAKTLIFETGDGDPLCVVMNGPFEVATGVLAKTIGTKKVTPCAQKRAEALTGYRVGGISPFGQRTAMPIYLQLDLFEFEAVFVNGGQRGFLVEVAPAQLEQQLGAEVIDVATTRS
ncbi:Cys-tRNA(Pro) deacylase [Pseudenhygromyxa sp. WMMC2535]|uniref:aminoacyl-tRNA deacylase n=1 Tax=Pseudenhygromyxa sp. WMMC2535 TaxID=2712867 RepID=UPI001557C9EE|nr:YbaK/EbsC family protein [Pseudenhygromyxa sp. WMMC2535]NVB38634.1 Cys-tRNA(Pro) deacylase [Pseudenhygromyxa sp. WMMC2535]